LVTMNFFPMGGVVRPLAKSSFCSAKAAGPASDFDDDALIGCLLNQRARKGPHTRMQRRNISLTAGIGDLSFAR